jgi:hypothetical protein
MDIRSKILAFVWGIIVVALVIPFTPNISLAEAKKCCNKKCSSMIVAPAGKQSTLPCKHQKDSVQCCQKNCANIITHKIAKPLSFIGVKTGIENTSTKILFSVLILDSSIQLAKLGFEKNKPLFFYKLKSPPLYLSNSILRI